MLMPFSLCCKLVYVWDFILISRIVFSAASNILVYLVISFRTMVNYVYLMQMPIFVLKFVIDASVYTILIPELSYRQVDFNKCVEQI